MERHCICSQHHKPSKQYFCGCCCHHYSIFQPPIKSRMLKVCCNDFQNLLWLADHFLLKMRWDIHVLNHFVRCTNSQQIITNTYKPLHIPLFFKKKKRVRFSLTFICTNIVSAWESWAKKDGKARQGKSLVSSSDMRETLPLHACSLRCFSRLRQDSSSFKSEPKNENTLAVFFFPV